MKKAKQNSFFEVQKSSQIHGGEFRKRRKGRGSRPLSTKNSHHIVFKINRVNIRNKSFRNPKNFKFVQLLLRRYAQKFFVKVEQVTYQHDHIHLIARTSRRSSFHNFFRVFAGQIAQNLKAVTDTQKSFWVQRPFTRIVKSWGNLLTLRRYLALNELEVTGKVKYQKNRLKELAPGMIAQLDDYLRRLRPLA